MEELISFLTHNFYFVILAVGIIYSLFFRKSPLENRPPNRMPDFGGSDQQTKQPEPEIRKPAPQQPRTIRVDSRQRESLPSLVEDKSTVDDAYALESSPIAMTNTTANMPKKQNAVPRTGGSGEVQGLASTELARAVMWAEILGPPRARKPYRR
ncbi:hypothetical protein [Cohnella mopanensis]|uniref:hypothetical protein n=1 Tax=Cohnella mopanensis TaxID=2911966 RepID=UPI001EF86590|nr:hypothetical protein [Cohnella mopanensis]